MVLQIGHRSDVTMLAFAARGKRLVSAGHDGLVKVWDVPTGEVRHTLRVDRGPVHENPYGPIPALSPDGKTLAVPAGAEGVHLWDLQAGVRRATLPRHKEDAESVIWASGSRTLAVLGDSGTHIWDVPRRTRIRTLLGVGDIAFMSDGRRAACAESGKIVLRDVRTGGPLRTFTDVAGAGTPLAISPDGRLLVAQGDDPEWTAPDYAASEAAYARHLPLVVWDLRTGRRLRRFGGYGSLEGGAQALRFVDGGRKLLSAGGQEGLELWDLRSGRRVRRLAEDGDAPLALSPDGLTLAAANRNAITLISLPAGERARVLPGGGAVYASVGAAAVTFSPDGALLASGDQNGNDTNFVRLWDPQIGRLTRTFGPFRNGDSAGDVKITLAPSGRVAASTPTGISVWDQRTGALTFERRRGWYLLSPDGATIVGDPFNPRERAIVLIDAVTGEERGALAGPQFGLDFAAFSPDGSRLANLAAASLHPDAELSVKTWDLATGRVERAYVAPGAGAGTRLGFSPDGRTLAATNRANDALLLWDAGKGNRHPHTITAVGRIDAFAFSRDGRLAALAGPKGVVLCDVDTGRRRRILENADAAALALAFSPDGARLVTFGSDGALRFWGVASGRLLATLHRLPSTGKAATPPEWIAVTPSGYYDASPGAARFLRWRVGDTLHPAGTYAAVFHRPDRVREALANR